MTTTGASEGSELSEHQQHEENSVTRHGEASVQAAEIADKVEKREGDRAKKQAVTDVHLDDLIVSQTEAVGKLAIGITAFADQYANAEFSRKKDRRVYLILIGTLLIVALILGAGVVRLNAIASDNKANGQVVKDCVDPAGKCYKDSRANQADTIKRIVDANHNGEIDTDEIIKAINDAKGLPSK